MDPQALPNGSRACPFCLQVFARLGNHLKGCPQRQGRDYTHLLSQKTLSKNTSKAKKMPCPKCGIKFERLDTHLRNSATCKNAPTQPSTSPSPTPVDTISATVPDPSSSQTQAQQPPTSLVTSPVSTLPAMKLPQTPEDWVEADQFFQTTIVPAVLMEVNVDTMNEVLCHGIYSFFTSKHGTIVSNQHHQHPPKPRRNQIVITKVKTEKNAVKKRLRQLRRSGNSPEEVRLLAQEFHQLVRKHSRLAKKARKADAKMSAKKQRKECHRDLHKFARKILEEDDYASIQPTFGKEEAESFFASTYSASPKSFTRPAWMPQPPLPTVPMVTSEFTAEEVESVIGKSRSASSPSPVDQIPYTVLKKCPSLMPALLHLFNHCWSTQTVPKAWKVGVIHLLGKKKAEEDPSQPSHFRPIALTSCVGKVFTSLLKQRWLSYMMENRYLNTSVQKAFIDGVPGCTEHHLKLLSIISEAQRKHKSLSVCWLDLANAFGSVHHELIRFSLSHYHAPQVMVSTISNLYEDLTGVISSKAWTTNPIHLQIGVYQGDPLSVLVFNTVMNTLVDTITKQYPDLGYSHSSSPCSTNLLQYADDTSLIADGPSSCRSLLAATESWLTWSGMKANVPKCVSLAIHSSSGKPYDPELTLNGEPIPYIGDSTFRFLGAPVSVHSTSAQAREGLLRKLKSLLEKVDATLITRQQKLRLFKAGICPRLSWDLSVSVFPLTWLQTKLQPLATRYLKRWCGLARSADTSRLFLPKANGGLDLPELTTMYKKLHAAKAASYMCSRDPTVRSIATQETLREAAQRRPAYRPFQEVVDVMKEDPGATKKKITTQVKAKVQAADNAARLAHSAGLTVQGQTVRDFQGRAADLWSTTVQSLPERAFKFALNAVTDTLPHNRNLFLWKKMSSPQCQLCSKEQTLHHVLNNCTVALEGRRYNDRHDSVLACIHSFLSAHLPQDSRITADLPNISFTFPQNIVATDERPDIVVWSDSSIHMVELTIPFETGIEDAAQRKLAKYAELVKRCRRNGFAATLTTIEVGSRGFIHVPSFNQLYQMVDASSKAKSELEREVIRRVIEESFRIWCKRNWSEHNRLLDNLHA